MKNEINKTLRNLFSKKNVLSIVFCFGLSILIILTVKGLNSFFSFRDSRGFDYDSLIEKEYDWTGPKIGENINLNYLKDRNGNSLPQQLKQNRILLSVVDPECGACKIASDQMQYIQENTKNSNINYAVISFSQKLYLDELPHYAESLRLSANTYSWVGGNDNILSSVKNMVLPSHILVDSDGNVIKTYPGTDKEKSTRDRMANQIIKEIVQSK